MEGPPWKMVYAGSVGDDISVEDAQKSAALAMVCTLANLKGALGGSLNRVDRFVKLMGFVRCRVRLHAGAERHQRRLGSAAQHLRPGPPAGPLSHRRSPPCRAGASVEIDAIVRLRD